MPTTYNIYKVRKPKMTKLGQVVEVRAQYPIVCLAVYICIYLSFTGCESARAYTQPDTQPVKDR